MQPSTYDALKKYLKDGEFPKNFPSTRSNFVREAKKYSLNRKGVLLKDQLVVVKKSERKSIFQQMHQHSGKDLENENVFEDEISVGKG